MPNTISMSPVDAAWLHMEDPTNLMMVTGVIMLKGQVDFARIVETFQARVVTLRRFRMRVRESSMPLTGPYWEDDPNFTIDAHIHRIAVAEPGGYAAFLELAGDLASVPLDFSKSPWQVHVVDNVDGNTAVVLRFHHCIADGIAMVAVTMRLFDKEPDTPVALPEKISKHYTGMLDFLVKPAQQAIKSAGDMANTLMQEGMATLQHPGRVLEFGALATQSAGILAHTLLMPGDPKTPFKGKLHVSKRVAVSPQMDLAEVKLIGDLAGGKVNDVLLAAMTGALRDYLIQRGTEVNGLIIRAVVPVNLRSVERALDLGNEFGLVFLELPIGLEDPLARVSNIRKQMDRIKKSPEAFLFFGVLNVFGLTPRQVEDQVVNIFGTKATAVMTNVAGPREEMFLAGSAIDHIMFWVPQAGHLGLGVSIYSYNGLVTLGVITDALLVPDPEKITDRFAHEFAVLKQAALAQLASTEQPGTAPAPRKRKKRQPKQVAPPSEPATEALAQPAGQSMADGSAPAKAARRRKSSAKAAEPVVQPSAEPVTDEPAAPKRTRRRMSASPAAEAVIPPGAEATNDDEIPVAETLSPLAGTDVTNDLAAVGEQPDEGTPVADQA